MYSPYSLARILKAIQHNFQGVFYVGFFVQSWQNFGHKFSDSSYSINCWDNRTFVQISGSEIEEKKLQECPDKFL
jgi:hypothetical protein